jgi:hypothetical protein
MKVKKKEPIQSEFNEATLDKEAGIAITGEEELYMITLTRFVNKDLSEGVQRIREKILSGISKEFREASHAIKGASS